MTVEFELKRIGACRVGTIASRSGWKPNALKEEFAGLVEWARRSRSKTGRWFFLMSREDHWVAALEFTGAGRSEGRVKVRTLPATWVARAIFDPNVVSPEVVYHGLTDWCRQQKREKRIRGVVSVREVYPGDPWRDRRAEAHAEAQFLVRR